MLMYYVILYYMYIVLFLYDKDTIIFIRQTFLQVFFIKKIKIKVYDGLVHVL